MFIKQVEKTNADGERKTHILYFLPFAQNKEAGHSAFEPRRRTSLSEDRP